MAAVRVESLPGGSDGRRRAVITWTDGSAGEALRWYGEETLVCEGDFLGTTASEHCSLKFSRDRDYLQG